MTTQPFKIGQMVKTKSGSIGAILHYGIGQAGAGCVVVLMGTGADMLKIADLEAVEQFAEKPEPPEKAILA